ncbi:MAG: ABC transporter ATP-binding protein [Pirellula sp.]|jgi:putative ABC transport system ATP-binding protein|nr:ABC transporter ATP-binding protein [Pirellula sp.]
MISVLNLEHQYREGGFSLSVPELVIEPAQSVALIGPSGSGKSTLLNLIAGTIPCQQGQIIVHGTRVDQLSEAEKRRYRVREIGFVFQELELIEHLSVRENILLPFLINRAAQFSATIEERCLVLARNVGLANKLERRPNQLSTGEKQRVAICRALITSPTVILADEPTGSLDPSTSLEILDLLLQQSADCGASVLVVTHDHSQLNRFSRTIDMKTLNRK